MVRVIDDKQMTESAYKIVKIAKLIRKIWYSNHNSELRRNKSIWMELRIKI